MMLTCAAAACQCSTPLPASGGVTPWPTPTVAAIGAISTNTNATGATAVTNGTPSSGDLVVVEIIVVDGSAGAGSTITPPSGHGFTLVDSAISSDSNCKIAVYWKRWGAGNTDATSMAFTGTSGNMRATAITISGAVATGTPYSAGEHAAASSSSSGTTATAPTVTTDNTNRLVLRFFACAASTVNVSAVSDTSVFSGASYAFTSGVDGAMACAKLTPGSGSTGTGTATLSTSAPWAAVTVAIDPT
jgi:hypothetical protein